MVDPAIVSSRISQLHRMVHLYWEVDGAMVYRILQENLVDFDTYVGYVLDYTEGATSESAAGLTADR